MEQKLMFWELDVLLRGVYDALSAGLEGGFELSSSGDASADIARATYQRYDLCWVLREVLRELVVVDYEMGDIDVAVVLLHQNILPDLISLRQSVELKSIPPAPARHTCR